MVVRNVTDLVKLEHSTRDFKIGVNEFLEDLKGHNIVEGLREVIESIQSGVANREVSLYLSLLEVRTVNITDNFLPNHLLHLH